MGAAVPQRLLSIPPLLPSTPNTNKVISNLVWAQALTEEDPWMLKICYVEMTHSSDNFAVIYFLENYPFVVVGMSNQGPFRVLVMRSAVREAVYFICSHGYKLQHILML